jgi:hypothetical protein
MLIHEAVEIVKPSHELFHWVHHLGGLGLIVLGLIDSSVIPIPGSMDALTIILAAKQRTLWPYFAFMATLGTQDLASADKPSHKGVREMGIRRSPDSSAAAASGSDGSVLDCRRRNAVFAQ